MELMERPFRWSRFEIFKNVDKLTGAVSYLTRAFDVISSNDKVSDEVAREVYEILDMFRALWVAKWHGWKASNDAAAIFAGFSVNDPHYEFAEHLLNGVGLYAESGQNKDSGTSDTLARYRRMLEVWNSVKECSPLHASDAEAIISA